MNRQQQKAMWAKHGKGFGLSYGWKTPDGIFHNISKRNIPESLRPKGGVTLKNGMMLDLRTGSITEKSTKDKCSWCNTVYDTKDHKECPNGCQNAIRKMRTR